MSGRWALVPKIAAAAAYRVLDLGARPCTDPARVPANPEALTTSWLSGVLGKPLNSHVYTSVSSGTSERGRLTVVDSDGTVERLFMKSTPTLLTRIANGITGTSAVEAAFYNDLRPALGVAAVPYGRHSGFEPRSLRSIHLIEDLVSTRGASFFDAATVLTRDQAEDAVTLLARIHRTYAGVTHPEVPTYEEWWTACLAVANVRGAVAKVARATDCPTALADPDLLWSLGMASISTHRVMPTTLLHGDPHPGNWFVDSDGRMGLLDWQCVSVGHWSRDLAYALVTLLGVDQRRAWEGDLVERYVTESGLGMSTADAMDLFASQLPGALLMWAPTLHPPRGFPAMQPQELAALMVRRILTAMDDHRAVSA